MRLSLQCLSLFCCIMEKGNDITCMKKFSLTHHWFYVFWNTKCTRNIYQQCKVFHPCSNSEDHIIYIYAYVTDVSFVLKVWWYYAFSIYINCHDSPPKLAMVECLTLSPNGDKERVISNSLFIRSQNSGIGWTVYCTD